MNTTTKQSYPTIIQSFGITLIAVLLLIVTSFSAILLKDIIGIEASTLIGYLLGMGATIWIVFAIKRRKQQQTHLNWVIKNPRIVPFLALGTLGLMAGIVLPLSELIPMPDAIKESFMELFGQRGIFTFILAVVAGPILEEVLFRGIILDGLLKKYSPVKSILISSLLFGLVHLNPWQFVAGLIMGSFMGWIYFKTHSLLPCIIVHATANLTGYLMRFMFSEELLNGASYFDLFGGLVPLFLSLSGLVILFAVSVYVLNRQFQNSDLKPPLPTASTAL